METFAPKTPMYPLFLSLNGLDCLLVGLGQVGQRKLAGLLACDPALVLVLERNDPPAHDASLQDMLRDERVRFERRTCTADDIHGKILVFAATGDADENRRIAALCRSLGVLCNCASTPEEGNFQVPAVARCAPLAAALSTGGASPALQGAGKANWPNGWPRVPAWRPLWAGCVPWFLPWASRQGRIRSCSEAWQSPRFSSGLKPAILRTADSACWRNCQRNCTFI